MSQREQSLLDSLAVQLQDSDAFTTDAILNEIEAAGAYQTPSHPDHVSYLKMRPMALARQMTLSGEDPQASGNDADSSMLDNQRYTHELYEEEKPLTFDDEDNEFETKRANIQKHLESLQKGEVAGVTEDDLPIFIETTQKQIIDMDVEQDMRVKGRESELDRMDKQENSWADERAAQVAEMKKDFMAIRMKNVLKDDKAAHQKLANEEWSRMASDYGF